MVLRARAEILVFLGLPSTITVAVCKLTCHFLALAFMAWERRLPIKGPTLVILHFLAIVFASFNGQYKSNLTNLDSKKQTFFHIFLIYNASIVDKG